jgi:small subunit ribosomal protein S4
MNERKHRSNLTEYGIQLKEKQKIRNVYGLSEKQFARYVKESTEEKGDRTPVDRLYEKLERRLDNVVFRLGLAKSRTQARQMVAHGHFVVGKRKLTIPSYQVSQDEVIAVREGSRISPLFTSAKETLDKHAAPNWISVEPTKLTATVKGAPKYEKGELGFNFQTVIEFYSR